MRRLAPVLVVVLAGGCSTLSGMFDSKVDYKTTNTLPPLEVPPDLTAPPRDNRYALPESRSGEVRSGGTSSGGSARAGPLDR